MKRKQSGEKRTSRRECPKLGVDRTYLGHALNVEEIDWIARIIWASQ